MLLFSTLLAAAAMQGAASDVTDVVIVNVRPSRITALLDKDVAGDCILRPLDKESKVRIVGPSNARRELVNWIKLFDVKPVTVCLAVQVVSKIDKVDYRLNLSVRNNETFSFTESSTGVRVALMPRLNGDGTVTLYSTLSCGSFKYEGTVRMKQGQFATVLTEGPLGKCSVSDTLSLPDYPTPSLIVSPTLPAP
jgi:hypothetical protein